MVNCPPPHTRARMISRPFFLPAIPAPRGVPSNSAAGGYLPKCPESATFLTRAISFTVWPAGRSRWGHDCG